MSTKRYETRWITVFIYGNGKFRIISDGLVNSGEWCSSELENQMNQLNQEGWQMVSSVDRKDCGKPYPAIDLYFRREKQRPNPPAEPDASSEKADQTE
ncbi:MAG: hypothetical protein PHQ40_21840 [Anaerolineaceae bacterium]|nr:hypothetical protein [Anaerolineaceae bacterium]